MQSVNVVRKMGLIAVMILSLTAQAAETKLWHTKANGGKELTHLGSGSDTELAVKWLTAPSSEPKFSAFVKKFQAEPLQFLEGVRKGILKLTAESKSVEEKRIALEELIKKLGEVESTDFKTSFRKLAYEDLLKKLNKLSFDKIEDEKDFKAFLEEVLKDEEIRKALGIQDTDPNAETPEKPDPNKGKLEAIQKQLEAERAARAQLEAAMRALQAQQGQVQTGEQDDKGLEDAGKIICDKIKALDDDREKRNQALTDALNAAFNKAATASVVPDAAQKEKKNKLEDILPGILAKAFEQPAATPAQAPKAPEAAQAAQSEGDKASPIDNAQIPAPRVEPEQAVQPLNLPTQSRATQTPPWSINIPTTAPAETAKAQEEIGKLDTAKQIASKALSNANMMAQISPNPFGYDSASRTLEGAKASLAKDRSSAEATLSVAKAKLGRLESFLGELKEGASGLVPSWVPAQEQAIQTKVDKAKRAMEQLQSKASMVGPDENARQALVAQHAQLQSQQNDAEDELAAFKKDKEAKIKAADKRIPTLEKQRDELNEQIKKLEGEVGAIRGMEGSIEEQITAFKAKQFMPAGGQNNGRPNVRAFSGGSSGAPSGQLAPRAPVSGGGLGGGTTLGGGERGPLRAK